MLGRKATAKKEDVAIGIDVGNFSIKVIQIIQKKEGMTLEGVGYCRIDPLKLDGAEEAIRKACSEARLSSKRVNASINPEGVVVRYLMLPEMSSEDLSRAMEFEIERYVPFERKDVVSDYMVLTERSDSKNMKVLLVAAKKEYLEKRVKVLKDTGLDPQVITIDSMVLKNVFQLNYPEKSTKTVGLFNIGSKVSNINIVKNSTSYFMRDVQLGGDSITHLLKEKLDIDFEHAEKLKCSLTPEDKDKLKIIEPVLGNLLNEVYLSFDYYESEFGMVVDEVFLSGGTAGLFWLRDFFKEHLNREVTLLNPFHRLLLNPSISKQKIEPLSLSLVVPLGLAMESFN